MAYADTKKWRKKNPERLKVLRRRQKLKKYGLTIEDYNKMFEEQLGCCAICNRHQTQLKSIMAVDHNHRTGEVRGLLCHQCNHAIGLFYENTNSLNNAIRYLS